MQGGWAREFLSHCSNGSRPSTTVYSAHRTPLFLGGALNLADNLATRACEESTAMWNTIFSLAIVAVAAAWSNEYPRAEAAGAARSPAPARCELVEI